MNQNARQPFFSAPPDADRKGFFTAFPAFRHRITRWQRRAIVPGKGCGERSEPGRRPSGAQLYRLTPTLIRSRPFIRPRPSLTVGRLDKASRLRPRALRPSPSLPSAANFVHFPNSTTTLHPLPDIGWRRLKRAARKFRCKKFLLRNFRAALFRRRNPMPL